MIYDLRRDDGILTASEDSFIRNAVQILTTNYPGWSWRVGVKGGIVDIACTDTVSQWAMRHPIVGCDDHQIMLAGGEILERFRQARSSIQHHTIPDQPRNARGHLIPDAA
jgi:hypothetical protein